MCLIIQRQPNVEIDFKDFESAIHTNPDGYGLTWADGNRLQTVRSPEKPDPEDFYRIINEELKDVPVMVHLRFTTAGKTNLRNAHPFPVLEKNEDGIDLRMAHNGTIQKYKTIASKDESDTRSFVKRFVRPLMKRMVKAIGPEELLKDEFTKKLLANEVPPGSVLSFIDSNGQFMNINELGNGGKVGDGVYFSNTYSFNRNHRTPSVSYYKGSASSGYSFPDYDDWGYGRVNRQHTSTTSSKLPKAMESSKVTKFTAKYGIKNLDELFKLSDSTIDEMLKTHVEDAGLLIKELLYELRTANTCLARYKRALDKKDKH